MIVIGPCPPVRVSMAHLSALTVNHKAEIIRQAIGKILALGPDGVGRTVGARTVEGPKRAGEAAVRADEPPAVSRSGLSKPPVRHRNGQKRLLPPELPMR